MNCCPEVDTAVGVSEGNAGVLGTSVGSVGVGISMGGVAVSVGFGAAGVGVTVGLGNGEVQNVKSSEQQLRSRNSLFFT